MKSNDSYFTYIPVKLNNVFVNITKQLYMFGILMNEWNIICLKLSKTFFALVMFVKK